MFIDEKQPLQTNKTHEKYSILWNRFPIWDIFALSQKTIRLFI